MSKQEAARTIGVNVATVDSWIARGLLAVQSTSGGEPRLSGDAVLALAERAAMCDGDLVLAAPGPEFGPED